MRFIIFALVFALPALSLANILDLEAEMKARGGEFVELEDEEPEELEAPEPTASTSATPPTEASEEALDEEVELVQQIEIVEVADWCSTGKNQSPVNLDLSKAIGTTDLAEVEIAYKDMALRLLHQENDLVADYPLGSYIKLGKERYELVQYKLKTPSEHQVNGFNYPLEIQIIHKNGSGNHLALSILVAEGRADENLQILLNNLPKEEGKKEVFENIKLNPAKFIPAETEFFYYNGSLTTGTCEEGTAWLVFQQPTEASVGQLMFLHKYLGDNSRETQPLNGRIITKSWIDKEQRNSRNQRPASSGYYFEY